MTPDVTIVCPHCLAKHIAFFDYEEQYETPKKFACGKCRGEFFVTIHTETKTITSKTEEDASEVIRKLEEEDDVETSNSNQ
jgi:hypothetical protein